LVWYWKVERNILFIKAIYPLWEQNLIFQVHKLDPIKI
jgi:hypothetical protein